MFLCSWREAAGSCLHFLFSGAVKYILYLHNMHWKPRRVHFGKLDCFFFLQIYLCFLWKKIAHSWGNMAPALKHMLKQMGREPESRGSLLFWLFWFSALQKKYPFLYMNLSWPWQTILICTTLKKTKTKLKRSRVNLLNTGYTKDVSSSQRVFIKIKFDIMLTILYSKDYMISFELHKAKQLIFVSWMPTWALQTFNSRMLT